MNCPSCNQPLKGDEAFCTQCGFALSKVDLSKTEGTDQNPSFSNFEYQPPKPAMSQNMPQSNYNNPNYDIVPAEIKKWNWGAFMFNAFWGIGNSAYMALLALIPYFNFIWVFVCGAKGNEWAWKSGQFKSVDEFLTVQRTWNKAGYVYFIIMIIFVAIALVIGLITGLFTLSLLSSYNY